MVIRQLLAVVRERWRGYAKRYPLGVAVAASLALHVVTYTGWRIGDRLGWWKYQATWLLDARKKKPPAKRIAELQRALAERQRERQAEIPLLFVDVDPTQAAAEPPKDPKFYGANSSKAANPDATIDSNLPKLDGRQEKLVRLEDVPRPKPVPLQPSEPPPAPEPKPSSQTPGDLAKANPATHPTPSDASITTPTPAPAPPPKRERPRTLAAAREQRDLLAGERTKQDAGVRRRGRMSFDVAGTTFGSYDAAFIRAVEQRWYDLIDNTPLAFRAGKVVLHFTLTYDGRIVDMQVAENETGETQSLLCQQAVIEPAPYARWPNDMRRAMGNTRSIQFTFFYN